MKFNLFVLLVISCNLLDAKLLDTSKYLISRQKRALIWSNAGINWVQFIFGLGLPIEVERHAITMGSVFKAFYTLPTNASSYLAPTIDYPRVKRSTSRWMLYEVLEKFIGRFNNGDGKSCILKSICEVAHAPLEERHGIISEIIMAVLQPSATDDELHHPTNKDFYSAEYIGKTEGNCDYFYPECKLNIIDQYSTFLT